jgi:hypothetical protein
MPATPRSLVAAAIGTASTVRYTVPAATTTIVKNVIICNTGSSDVSMSMITNGVSILSNITLKGSETMSLDLSLVLPSLATLSTSASAIGLSLSVSGVEIT